MICFNCKRQIPDNVPNCPNCGAPIVPAVQVHKEIKVRRWQRWIFYVIFIVLFLAAVGFALKVYSDNTALLTASTDLKNSLVKSQSDLATAQSAVTDASSKLTQAQTQLQQAQQDLSQKSVDLQQATDQVNISASAKASAENNLTTFQNQLSAINPNVFYAAKSIAITLSKNDLMRIPVADYNLGLGKDSDSDGLSDEVEVAFGTDPNKADTDGDGFNDKQEVIGGFDPLAAGTAKLPIDAKFSVAQKGKVIRQAGTSGADWYWFVGSDGKRQYLGIINKAIDAFKNTTAPAAVTIPAGTVPALTGSSTGASAQ